MYGCQSMIGSIEKILIKHPKDAFISQENLDATFSNYGFLESPNYEKCLEEYAEFEDILRKHVPEIHYLSQNTGTGLDSLYTHDPVKITSKGAIYFPMGKPQRGGEGLATRTYFESIGVPTLGVIEAPCRIEGGDVVWIDERTVAIGRGYRTNDAGIQRFRELTKDIVDEIIVVPMPHADGPEACLHLMSIISFVDSDLAVVYSKYMPVFFREYLLNRGVTLIETPDDEYDTLGTNILALAPRICVILQGNDTVKARLEAAGAAVYDYPGRNISYFGTGGPTCLTSPFLRK